MGAIYDDERFKQLMNRNYYPLENMRESVAILKASDEIDIRTMEWGQYQPILSPREKWPNGSGKAWFKSAGQARIQLAAQPNATPLSKDENVVVPPNKCALLDASVRKCFNSEPPIPIWMDTKQHRQDAPDADRHEISLVWEHANGEDQPPTLLRLTMICPYVESEKKPADETASAARR